jgi:hypothetical protein
MSSQLDPEVGRDDPSPHAPKSTDLDGENSSAAKESSGQTDEHRAMAAERQLPVARLLNDAGQRLDDGPPPEHPSMSNRPDRTGTVESSPSAPKATDLAPTGDRGDEATIGSRLAGQRSRTTEHPKPATRNSSSARQARARRARHFRSGSR